MSENNSIFHKEKTNPAMTSANKCTLYNNLPDLCQSVKERTRRHKLNITYATHNLHQRMKELWPQTINPRKFRGFIFIIALLFWKQFYLQSSVTSPVYQTCRLSPHFW